jgi:8-oxo-dGTP diphosphatase
MASDKNSPPDIQSGIQIETRPLIGVGVLVWREKKLLLGERITENQSNCWQFPGGCLESGESVIECAQREVLEETSLRVKGLRHFAFTDKAFDAGKHEYITLLVSCEYSSGEAEALEADKCAGWQWFDYRELPTPLFEPITNFISQAAVTQKNTSAQCDLYALHCASMVLPDASSGEHK